MKIIYNNILPFNSYYAITILNCIFIKYKYKYLENSSIFYKMLQHEKIHWEQEKELGFIFFYLFYLLEWIIKLMIFRKNAYRHISFEKEAYNNEMISNYLTTRKHYAWIKYLFS